MWYKSQNGVKKWLLIFILNWLYWGIVYSIPVFVLGRDDEDNPAASFLFQTTFMAIFWTLVWDVWLSPILKRKYGVKSQSDNK
jgi:hypothetical protein